jgi:hypothetical protein
MSCGLNFLREGARDIKPLPSPHHLAYGLDFGSRFVKLVYPRGRGAFGRRKLDSIIFYRDYLVRVQGRLGIDWDRWGLGPPEALVATGYGKNLLQAHFPTITEIRAHFRGARSVTGLDHFILLEMGGQDTKVLYIREGKVFDFLTNDRCAAGTGRYLENMARFLKMPLAEFSGYWRDPVDISQTCAIFGETELVGHLLEGVVSPPGSTLPWPAGPWPWYAATAAPPWSLWGASPKTGPWSGCFRTWAIFRSWCLLIPNSTAPWAVAWRLAAS